MLFPMFAALYYFYPFVTARKLSDRLGRIAFWPMFAGFNVAFLPMHLTGLLGMPRRVFTYPAGLGWDGLNLVSTLRAFVLALGLAVGRSEGRPSALQSLMRIAYAVVRWK